MKRVKTFIYTFILWTAVGLLGRLFFLAYYGGILTDVTATEHLQSLLYGLRLDTAIAGYLTLLPGLMLIASLWYRGRPLRYLWRGYFILTSLLVALAYVANIGLYGYWGFPLDSTPLLYLRTSPADAVASLTPMQMVLAVVALLACTCAIAAAHIMTSNSLWRDRHSEPAKVQSSIFSTILLLLLTAMLIIPIRGGFGTGTNHTGSVYFSSNIRLNHATVNPVFSFMESALHREEIGSKYRFMGDFDKAMLDLVKSHPVMQTPPAWMLQADEENKTVVYERGNLIFVFNWGFRSIPDYEIPVRQTGDYQIILTTDDRAFGGFGNIDASVKFPSEQKGDRITMKVYNVSRVATVYERIP